MLKHTPSFSFILLVSLLALNAFAQDLPSGDEGSVAAPSDAAPSDAAPSDAAPSDAAPSDAAPSDAAPSDAAPSDAASATPAPVKPIKVLSKPKEGRVTLEGSPKAQGAGLEELPLEVLPDAPVAPEPEEKPAPTVVIQEEEPAPSAETPQQVKLLPKPTLPRLLVLELLDKGAGKEITSALSEAMAAQALKSHAGEVITAQQLALLMRAQQVQQSLGCDSMDCFVSLAELTSANKILSGSVSKVGNDILISLREVEPGEANSKNLQRKVPLHQDLYYYATRQLTSLILTGKAVNSRVPVRIGASFEGGVVLVDGQGMGLAPLTLELDPGFHEVRVTLDGFVPWRTQIEVQEATPAEVYAILTEEGLTLWPAAAVSAGLGVVALGGAAVLFAYAANAYGCNEKQGICVPIPENMGGYAETDTYLGAKPANKALLRERQRAVQLFYFGSVGTASVGGLLLAVGGVFLAADLFE